MKKISSIFFACALFMVVLLTGCGKKADYKDYIGYQFSGKDPWGNELAVTVRELEDNKLTWTYTDAYGTGSDSFTVYSEATSDFKDGSASFNVKGKTDSDLYTFDYSGTISLKDGNVVIEYEKGSISSESTEGGSSSYQVGALSNKTVTLKKVEDKA